MAQEYQKLKRTENTKRNISYGLLNKIIAMLFPFAVRTVMIYRFGAEYLGMNSVFSSILQVLSLAELGFGTAVVFSLYEPIAKDDTETIRAYLRTYRNVYRAMGAVVLALGLIIMPFLPYMVHDRTVPGGLNIYLWFFVYLSDAVISYLLFAYKMCIPTAFQRDDLISKVDMGIMTIKSTIQIIVLFTSTNFYLYLIVFPVTTILRNLWINAMVNKRFPQYSSCKGAISREQKADLRQRVGGLMINKICLTSRNGIDSVCISAFIGLTASGIYHSYFYVLNALVAFSTILCTAMTPGVGNSIVTETKEKNFADLRRFNFLYMVIAGWATVCLLCLYQPFVRVWLGESLMLDNNAVIALCVYFYILKMGDMRWVYSEAAGLWWQCRFYMLSEAIVNVALNILFVKLWGVFGIILATIISLLFINFFGSTRIVFRDYFKNGQIGRFFLDHLRYFFVTLLITLISLAACHGAGVLIGGGKWIQLIIRILVCCIVPTGLYLLFYGRTEEFKRACDWLRKKVLKVEKNG